MGFKKMIVGLGEALFDVFPDESRLGGAPLNVAVHAHQLGNEGVVVSRVGQDALGRRLVAELAERGMSTALIQTDPDRPTGTVEVDFDDAGEPTYQIVCDVAWDAIQFDFDLEDTARENDAVCFGTLAQRDGQSRNTIYRYLEIARGAVRLLDVNLRAGAYDRRLLVRSLELATAVKLNTQELRTLDEQFKLGGSFDDAARRLMERFALRWVALTRGTEGTVLYTPSRRHEVEPVRAAGGEGADSVGAGDATAAALLHGVVRRWPWPRTLELANALGAYVASRRGACPPLTEELRRMAGGGDAVSSATPEST